LLSASLPADQTGLIKTLEARVREKTTGQAMDGVWTELLTHLDNEFKTTLTGLVGAQQMLAESDLHEDQQDYLELSMQATEHLIFLVEHLKTLTALGRTSALEKIEQTEFGQAETQ
jgi:nitrogen-specific signal transduction histidine kinase